MLQRILKIYICFILTSVIFVTCRAQDKIYMRDGKVLTGKVVQITPYQIHYYVKHGPDSVLYIINQWSTDSIIFSNGAKEIMGGLIQRKNAHENIPELNTWAFDIMGFLYLSISQSYERRLKNGFMGIRIPLYVGFRGGAVAGVGTYIPAYGGVVFPPVAGAANNTYGYSANPGQLVGAYRGFSIATGVNPKFYLFKFRFIRAFIGPEVTIGYSTTTNQYEGGNYNTGLLTAVEHDGTFVAVARAGLMIHPIDRFNICVDGGMGAECMFGKPTPLGWAGAWHFGFALGTNF
jgi:hypothetical protein